MVTVAQLFTAGLRSSMISHKYTKAVVYAKSKLNELGLSDNIEPGITYGVIKNDNNFSWEVQILKNSEEFNSPEWVEIYKVKVIISFKENGKNRTIELTTLRNKIVETEKSEP